MSKLCLKVLLTAACVLFGASAFGSPVLISTNVDDLEFEEPRSVGMAKALYYRGQFANNPKYTPWDQQLPVSFITPRETDFTEANPARLIAFLHPDDGGSGSFVLGAWQMSQPRNTIEIRNQEDSYEDGAGGWWGYTGGQTGEVGNYNGERIATSIDYVLHRFGAKVDIDQGIILRGTSLGGTGAILQSMIMPRHRERIAIVDATIANMLFVKCCLNRVRNSWAGQPVDGVDFRIQAPNLTHIHYFLRGGSNDSLGVFDLEFFEICERERISCAGTWLRGGHSPRETGYNLPTQLFLDPNQDARLDQVLPVITNFSGNNHNPERGHHNRGISWNQSGIVDSALNAQIPLKYVAMTDLGESMPDQPDQVSFSVTPRRLKEFKLQPGQTINWTFGAQSGQATVAPDGLLTIADLVLPSADSYTSLTLTHAARQ